MDGFSPLRTHLLAGQVIPAHPLALTSDRRLDERRQRALTRYYLAAGVGGLAVGVHTTQFAIRDPRHNLLKPVLALTADTVRAAQAGGRRSIALIAGAVGPTAQAVQEAELAAGLGYDATLLSLGAWRDAPEQEILAHCRRVSEILPLFGFYLQPAVGGRELSYEFWRAFAELPNLVAIKIAPFDRYRTIDVVRAVSDAGRADVALYTGNDDSIVVDLLSRFRFGGVERRIVGGLLGQWAVWTRRAVELLQHLRRQDASNQLGPEWLALATQLTDANSAIFDARHQFAGCLPGIHEVLRRQGLMAGISSLDGQDQLSPGQADEISRVIAAYPELRDDGFVSEHLDEWLG